MIDTPQATMSRRDRWLWAAVMVAPFLLFIAVRLLGYMSFMKLAVLGVAALSCAAVMLLRPLWALWLMVFYFYAGLNFYFTINLAGLITLVVLAAVVLELILGGVNRLNDPLFWYASAIFLLVGIGSMIWAKDPMVSVSELVVYLKMVMLTYLIVQLVRTPVDLRRMMAVIFAGGVATVFLGVMNLVLGLQSASENYLHGSAYLMRFMGTHGNPNRAAAYMCSTLPLGIFFVRHSRRRLRPLWILACLILLVAIFATFSRSVVFPLGVIGVAVLLREVRNRRSYATVGVLLVLGIILMPQAYWERVAGLQEAFTTTTVDWSVYLRLLALRTAWELFLAHPLTGIGIGNFIVTAAYQLFVRIVVHNSYLEILVGTGVFGLTSFLFILFSGFRHTVAGARERWRGQPPWLRSACFYCALSAISIWMSAGFGTMPFRQPFWIPVATGLVIANLLRADRTASA